MPRGQILTALAKFRAQPGALARSLIGVANEVLERYGVILAQLLAESAG